MKKIILRKMLQIVALATLIPLAALGQITSAANGNWDNTATWTDGVVPATSDKVVINHNVTIPTGTTVEVVQLSVSTLQPATLENNGTLNIMGQLYIYPNASYIGEGKIVFPKSPNNNTSGTSFIYAPNRTIPNITLQRDVWLGTPGTRVSGTMVVDVGGSLKYDSQFGYNNPNLEYASTATLYYKAGGTFAAGPEFANAPNVVVEAGASLTVPNTITTTGNLTIEKDAKVTYYGHLTARDIVISGSLTSGGSNTNLTAKNISVASGGVLQEGSGSPQLLTLSGNMNIEDGGTVGFVSANITGKLNIGSFRPTNATATLKFWGTITTGDSLNLRGNLANNSGRELKGGNVTISSRGAVTTANNSFSIIVTGGGNFENASDALGANRIASITCPGNFINTGTIDFADGTTRNVVVGGSVTNTGTLLLTTGVGPEIVLTGTNNQTIDVGTNPVYSKIRWEKQSGTATFTKSASFNAYDFADGSAGTLDIASGVSLTLGSAGATNSISATSNVAIVGTVGTLVIGEAAGGTGQFASIDVGTLDINNIDLRTTPITVRSSIKQTGGASTGALTFANENVTHDGIDQTSARLLKPLGTIYLSGTTTLAASISPNTDTMIVKNGATLELRGNTINGRIYVKNGGTLSLTGSSSFGANSLNMSDGASLTTTANSTATLTVGDFVVPASSTINFGGGLVLTNGNILINGILNLTSVTSTITCNNFTISATGSMTGTSLGVIASGDFENQNASSTALNGKVFRTIQCVNFSNLGQIDFDQNTAKSISVRGNITNSGVLLKTTPFQAAIGPDIVLQGSNAQTINLGTNPNSPTTYERFIWEKTGDVSSIASNIEFIAYTFGAGSAGTLKLASGVSLILGGVFSPANLNLISNTSNVAIEGTGATLNFGSDATAINSTGSFTRIDVGTLNLTDVNLRSTPLTIRTSLTQAGTSAISGPVTFAHDRVTYTYTGTGTGTALSFVRLLSVPNTRLYVSSSSLAAGAAITDTVVIPNGITLTSDGSTFNSVKVRNGGTLSVTRETTINNLFELSKGETVGSTGGTLTATATVNLNGDVDIRGTVTADNATVNIAGKSTTTFFEVTKASTIGTLNYNKLLTVRDSISAAENAPITVTTKLSLNQGGRLRNGISPGALQIADGGSLVLNNGSTLGRFPGNPPGGNPPGGYDVDVTIGSADAGRIYLYNTMLRDVTIGGAGSLSLEVIASAPGTTSIGSLAITTNNGLLVTVSGNELPIGSVTVGHRCQLIFSSNLAVSAGLTINEGGTLRASYLTLLGTKMGNVLNGELTFTRLNLMSNITIGTNARIAGATLNMDVAAGTVPARISLTNSLVVSNGASLEADLYVPNVTLNAGLDLSGHKLNISGGVSGTGSLISANAASSLYITGTVSAFVTPAMLKTLYLNVTNTLSLTQALTIHDSLYLKSGTLAGGTVSFSNAGTDIEDFVIEGSAVFTSGINSLGGDYDLTYINNTFGERGGEWNSSKARNVMLGSSVPVTFAGNKSVVDGGIITLNASVVTITGGITGNQGAAGITINMNSTQLVVKGPITERVTFNVPKNSRGVASLAIYANATQALSGLGDLVLILGGTTTSLPIVDEPINLYGLTVNSTNTVVLTGNLTVTGTSVTLGSKLDLGRFTLTEQNPSTLSTLPTSQAGFAYNGTWAKQISSGGTYRFFSGDTSGTEAVTLTVTAPSNLVGGRGDFSIRTQNLTDKARLTNQLVGGQYVASPASHQWVVGAPSTTGANSDYSLAFSFRQASLANSVPSLLFKQNVNGWDFLNKQTASVSQGVASTSFVVNEQAIKSAIQPAQNAILGIGFGATAPVFRTLSATNVGSTTAQLNADITPNGHTVGVGFQYQQGTAGAAPADWTNVKKTSFTNYTDNTTASQSITGLDPDKTYDCRAVINFNNNEYYGDVVQFKTGLNYPSNISSLTVSNIGTTSADVTFSIANLATAVTYRVVFSTTASFVSSPFVSGDITAATDAKVDNVPLTGLTPNTKYYVKVEIYKRNTSDKLFESDATSFTTVNDRPTVLSVVVTPITATTATSTVSVNWNNGESSMTNPIVMHVSQRADFGIVEFDGIGVKGTGASSTSYSGDFKGLEPSTKYYIRAIARNDASKTDTSYATFTTLASAKISLLQPSNITETSAVLNASVSSEVADLEVIFYISTRKDFSTILDSLETGQIVPLPSTIAPASDAPLFVNKSGLRIAENYFVKAYTRLITTSKLSNRSKYRVASDIVEFSTKTPAIANGDYKYLKNIFSLWDKKSKPSDYKQTEWRLIGLPGLLPNTTIRKILNLDFNKQNTHWQIYAYDPNNPLSPLRVYSDNDPKFNLDDPGKGFWAISSSEIVFASDMDIPNMISGNVKIPVRKGWNIITNPFPKLNGYDALNWDEVKRVNAISQPIWAYNGTWNEVKRMDIYTGYFYYHDNDNIRYLDIPLSAVYKQFVGTAVSQESHITANLKSAGYEDKVRFGFSHSKINNEFKPKAMTNAVGLSILSETSSTEDLGSDIRVISQGKGNIFKWEIVAQTEPYQHAVLSFNHLKAVPAGMELALYDHTRKKAVFMKAGDDTAYTFQAIKPKSNFTLMIGNMSSILSEVESIATKVLEISMRQNFPNPFSSKTVIQYELPEAAHVVIRVYDAIGREVAVLVNADKSAGLHSVIFDGASLPSGRYFYRMVTKGKTDSKSMILVK